MYFFCKNALNGTCHFGAKNCWFNHDDNEVLFINENVEYSSNTEEILKEVKMNVAEKIERKDNQN